MANVSKELILEVKVKADGSRKTVADLEKDYKELLKTVKTTVSGTEEQRKAIEKLTAVEAALKEEKQELLQATGKLNNALGGVSKEAKFAEDSLGRLKQQQREIRQELLLLSTTSVEFDVKSQELREVNELIREAEAKGKAAGSSLKEQFSKALSESNEEVIERLKALNEELRKVDEGSEEFSKLSSEIDKLSKSVDKVDGEVSQLGNTLKTGFGQVASAITGAFAIDQVVEYGVAAAEAVEKFDDLRDAISTSTGLTGEELDKAAVKAAAIAQSFGLEQQELLSAAQVQAKAYGISLSESLEIVRKGVIAGANSNGEYLESLKKLSFQAAQSGQGVEEFNTKLAKAGQSGIELEAAGEVLKEFTNKIAEDGAKVAEELSSVLGVGFGEEVVRKVKEGVITQSEALSLVSSKIKEAKITTDEYGKLSSSVFGSASEKVSKEFIENYSSIPKTLEGVTVAAKDVVEQQNAIVAANEELAKATAELSDELNGVTDDFAVVKIQVQTLIIQGLSRFIAIIKSIPEFIKENRVAIAALGVAFVSLNIGKIISLFTALRTALIAQVSVTRITTAAQLAFNAAMTANPVGLVITAVSVLVAGLSTLYSKFEEVRGVVQGAFAFISTAAEGLARTFVDRIGGIGKLLEGVFTLDFNKVKEGVAQIGKSFSDTGKVFSSAGKAAVNAYNKEVDKGTKDIGKKVSDNVGKSLTSNTASVEKAGNKVGNTIGKSVNDSAAKELAKLQEAIGKLKFEARVEILGGEQSINGLLELQRKALEELSKQEGFSSLSREEQSALLFKKQKEYEEKILQVRIDGLNKAAEANEKYFSQQLSLLNSEVKRRDDILNNELAVLLKNNQLNALDRADIEKQYAEKVLETTKAFTEEQEIILRQQTSNNISRLEEEAELRKKLLQEQAALGGERGRLAQTELERVEKEKIRSINEEMIKLESSLRDLSQQRFTAEQTFLDKNEALLKARRDDERETIELELRKAKIRGDAQAQIDAVNKLYRFEREEVGLTADKLITLREEREAAIREILEKETGKGRLSKRIEAIKALYDFELSIAGDTAEELDRIESEKTKRIAEEYGKQIEIISSSYSQIANATQALTETIVNLNTQAIDKQIESNNRLLKDNNDRILLIEEKEEGAFGRRLERLQAEKEAIQQENAAIEQSNAELEQKKAEEQRKAARVKKALDIAQVIIETAKGVTAAVAASPLTFGLPFSAFVAAVGAANLAKIASQKLAKGGIIPGGKADKGGVLIGKSHREGGVKILSSGGIVEAEGGEIVLTKGVYDDPRTRRIASALNVSKGGISFDRGGVLPKLESGGVIPPTSVEQQAIATQEALVKAISEIQPVVAVEEINKVQKNLTKVKEIVDF